MEHMILWFNILGFSLLFASISVTYVIYHRLHPKWLSPFLMYIGSFALFSIMNSYTYFIKIYVDFPNSLIDTVIIYVSSFFGLFLLWVVPFFIQTLHSRKKYQWYTHPSNIIVFIFAIAMLFFLLLGKSKNSNVGSAFFNGYLGCVTLRGLVLIYREKKYKQLSVVVPFLYVTGPLFLVVAIEHIALSQIFNQETTTTIQLFTSGLISTLIAIVTLGSMFIKRNEVNTSSKLLLSTQFVNHFSLTKREQEIIPMLIQGKTNKEIGEILYISIRTVDTHIYNIYKKCSVKNKLELAHLISSHC